MTYIVIVCGGRGPDTWETALFVEAETIRAALDKAEERDHGGVIVSIEQAE